MSYDPYYTDPYADEEYNPAEQYYTPEQLALMQQLLGQGQPYFDPMMGMDPTMTGMFGGMAMPQMDTKGRIQPFDLGVQTQLTNFGQDIGSSIGNNMMAYMSGPGSYAPGALDPVYDEKPLQLTQGPQLQMLSQTGGIRGTIADLILGGMNAGQAAARVREIVQNPDKFADVITPEEAAQMRSELPMTRAELGMEPEPDFNTINQIADDIYRPYLQEQAMLQQPDVQRMPDGRIVQLTQRDSPQMEWLKKMGLPDPRAQYDVKYALESDPTLVSMLNSVAGSQQERDTMRKEFDDRLKRIKKYREDDITNKARDAKLMERFSSATKQAMSDYFGQMGRQGAARIPDIAAPAGVGPLPSAPGERERAVIGRNTGGYFGGAFGAINQEPPRAPTEGGGGGPDFGKAWDVASGSMRPFAALHGAADFIEGIGAPNASISPDWGAMGEAAMSAMEPGKAISGIASNPRGLFNVVKGALFPAAALMGGDKGTPEAINGITPNLPPRPILSDMTTGLNPEGYSMLGTILGQPLRDVVGAKKRRAADEAIDPQTAARMYMAREQGIDKRSANALTKYLLGLAPTVVAGRQGRSPRTDAIQQRLAPLYQIGALGQRAG
jgi:hypothetical protein